MFEFNIKRSIRFLFLILLFDLTCLPSTALKNPKSEIDAKESKLVFKDTVITQSPDGVMKYLGKFSVTFYWVVKETDYNGPKNTPLYLENGSLLGYFDDNFVKDFKKESCAELKNGTSISYLKKANKARIVNKFLGFNGHTITPLQSIAVDPNVIPLGSEVYIPALTKLASHSGKVRAHDIGSLIQGYKIDIFVGYKEDTKLLTNAGIASSSLVDVYLLE